MILEAIYEPTFSAKSHGFRPKRSCHTALIQVQKTFVGAKWIIEGDIKACFDSFNHHVLIDILREMLKAGYMEQDAFCDTPVGTGQGSVLSPLLANVYLNDFDWYVGRKYYHPPSKAKLRSSDMRKLRQQGIFAKYNIRFADDWVILTTAEKEAYRLKKELSKYFKHRLKLEISEDKTVVTDMTVSGVRFLGFNIRVGKSERGNGNYVTKPYPDHIKLGKKIKNLRSAIREIKDYKVLNCRVAQIEYVNSVIMGIAEYIKIGISGKAFHAIDRRVNNCALSQWKRMYPDNYNNWQIPLKDLHNLPHRHEGYKSKTFAIPYEGYWFGLTMAFITHVKYEKKPFNQRMTPYTAEGRRMYENYRNKLSEQV
jgi:group II intron reverse transcriptase/maturase